MAKEINKQNLDDAESGSSVNESGQIELDARGLYCPEPVMLLHNKIRDIAEGQTLKLTATDPSTTRDVPKFCMYLGHELLSQEQQGELFLYVIQKKQE